MSCLDLPGSARNDPFAFGDEGAAISNNDDTKPLTSNNFSTALNSMSGEDESFPGWASHRTNPEDLLSSPLWTDPSPALTDNHSFDVGSCDTSPLLVDDLEGPSSDVAYMPLFGDMTLFSPAQALEHSFQSGNATTEAPFSLFPEVSRPPSPPRAQLAFNPAATVGTEDANAVIFRALQQVAAARQPQGPVATAAPGAISTPPQDLLHSFEGQGQQQARAAKPPLQHSATAPSLLTTTQPRAVKEEPSDNSSHENHGASCSQRGTKRRLGVDDLLPIDAPVQVRNYLGPSATSRKDWVPPSSVDHGPSAEEIAAIQAESDPLAAKRLSNTLAARRSRHRKAQEREEYQQRIAELEAEANNWKKRCERAEEERDALSEQVKKCRC